MSSFCSVGLSATLVLLEAEVLYFVPHSSLETLQVSYASALNRFLNYAHSLTMSQSSMYGAAKQLGINSFVVDVRHLCSHGAALPALETLQLCAESCKKWLRLFYWDNLLEECRDVVERDISNLACPTIKEFSFLLSIYDFTAHQIFNRRRVVGEIGSKEVIDQTFSQYAKTLQSENLLLIRGQVLKDCLVILEKHQGKLSVVHVFCRLIIEKMKYFLADAMADRSANTLEVTVVHQNFFHMIASAGIVGEVLRKLLTSCIDATLDPVTRDGAGFWARQVLRTCSALKAVRKNCSVEMSPEEQMNINWESINTKSLDRTIERAFATEGLPRESSLIFGESKKNVWKVEFTREFVRRQVKHVTAQNLEAHLKLLEFVEPPLNEESLRDFRELIESFIDPLASTERWNKSKGRVELPMDYEIKDLVEPEAEDEEDDLGIWSCPDEGLNWEKCCIGSHLLHVNQSN